MKWGNLFPAIMMEAGNAEAAVNGSDLRRRVSIHRFDCGECVECGARPLALLLRPSMLDDFGLVPALQLACARDDQTNRPQRAGYRGPGVRRSFRTSTRPASTGWFRRRSTMARAMQARVISPGAVKNQSDRVIFSVQDDGSGFDKASVRGLEITRDGRAGTPPRRDVSHRFSIRDGALRYRRSFRCRKWPKRNIMPPHFAYCWLTITRWCAPGMVCCALLDRQARIC